MVLRQQNYASLPLIIIGLCLVAAPASALELKGGDGQPKRIAQGKAAKATSADTAQGKAGRQWLPAPAKQLKVDGLVRVMGGWTAQDRDGVAARPALSVHRARMWLRGAAHKRLRFVVHFAFDRIGVDEYALLQGKPFSASRSPVIQDAMLQADLIPSIKLRLTAGFLRPTVGRENNSIVPALPNHEVALTGVLARMGSVQTGHGRAAGATLGGRLNLGPAKVIYHAGVFGPTSSFDRDKTDTLNFSSSMGAKGSPLLSGSLIIGLGKINQLRGGDLLFLANPWSKGSSLMVGVSGAQQGETERNGATQVLSAFAAVHWGPLVVDGEWVAASRENPAGDRYGNQAWHARAGYNIRLGATQLTPYALYSRLDSDDISATDWGAGANTSGLFAGAGEQLDVGVNWHLRKHKLRLGLHVIRTDTTATASGPQKLPLRAGWSTLLSLQAMR